MKDYLNFQPEDFAQDEFFVGWVKSTDIEAETYWQNWLETYPFMRHKVEIARKIVLLAHSSPGPVITDYEIGLLKQSVFSKLEELEEDKAKTRRIRRTISWAVAASASMLILFAAWWNFNRRQAIPAETYAEQLLPSDETIEVVNSGQDKRLITLPDGSSVLLKRNSKIAYPVAFGETQREVHLTGEAFFEIAKDPSKPFLVRAQEFTTRVLGTSFNVSAYPDNGEVSVFVKTGKVSVYRSVSDSPAAADSLVLIPNQQAFFTRDNKTIVPKESVKEQKLVVSREIGEMLFEYDETLVSEIFRQLEEAYNVTISYDRNVLGNCPVTASLTGEPFHEKLKLICMAVRADFRIDNNDVVITGSGCDEDKK